MYGAHLPIRFAATLLVGCVGFGTSTCRQNRTTTSVPTGTPQTSPSPSPIDFVDYYGYIKQASLTCRDLPSTQAANEMLDSKLPHGDPLTKIITRGFKINGQRKRVGRRVVSWFCCGKEGQTAAHVYWTDGSKFCDIIAASVDEALAYEKSHKL
jgi:hypothetical protein